MERRRLVGIGLVLVSACAFGSGALFGKPAYAAGIDWLVLSSWRFLFGAAASWIFVAVSAAQRDALRSLDRRAVAASLALGVLYLGNSGTYYAGLQAVDASLAALIVYIYPALVAVLTLRVGQPLEGRRAWTALALALVGVVLAVSGIDQSVAPPLTGLVLIVASPIIYAVWIVLAARLSGERRSDETGARPESSVGDAIAAASALMMTATAVGYWGISLALGRPVLPAQIPLAAWPNLVGIGLVATFIAIQTFYAGTRRIGAAQASLLSTVEPIWTISMAAVLLGESLGPIQLAGGVLILLGVVVSQTGPSAARTPRPAIRLADE
jgi:drug/metabolite transporter (DMT)-like permease